MYFKTSPSLGVSFTLGKGISFKKTLPVVDLILISPPEGLTILKLNCEAVANDSK